jgi:hypothetical protein
MSLRTLLRDHAFTGTSFLNGTGNGYAAGCECGEELGIARGDEDAVHHELRDRWATHVLAIILRAVISQVLEAELAKEEIT